MKTRAMDIDGCHLREIRYDFLTGVPGGDAGKVYAAGLFRVLAFLWLLSPFSAFAGETGTGNASAGSAGRFLVPVLVLALTSLLVLVAVLGIRLRRQSARLRKSHEYLVRYITSNLELKKQVPGLEEPYPFDPPEITPEEFTKVIDHMLKRIMFLSLCALLSLPLLAQEAGQECSYAFRFVRGKAAFLVPYRENGPGLDRLVLRLDSCRAQLEDGRAYVSVTGYVPSGKDERASYRMGYLRNSHVKSALITRAKLSEGMFVTDKVIMGSAPDGLSDVVVVTFPAPVEKVEQIAGKEAAEKVAAYRNETLTPRPAAVPQEAEREVTPSPAEKESPEPPATPCEPVAAAAPTPQPAPATPRQKNGFSLRANLLRWATLTPDLGIEWRINPGWGVLLNGSWTSWSWNDKDRRYALWNISPAIHYYIGKQKHAYVGAMFQTGEFNYKFSETGKQGDYYGGGITGGYRLPVGKRLAMDFSLCIGYTRAEYDKYAVIDNVCVNRGKETKNYWGVNHAGITLVWELK